MGSHQGLAAIVAHETNRPLFVTLRNLELLQDDFDEDSEPFQELEGIKTSLQRIKGLVKKMSQIEKIFTRDYDGTSRIVDLDVS